MTDPRLPRDPSDPLPDLPMPPPRPVKPGKPHRSPGRANAVFLGISIVGMLVFSPILFKLKQTDSEYLFTAPIILRVLGFFFFLLMFALMVGIRFVFWLADWFVDLIFSTHGGGYADHQPISDAEAEEENWYVRPPTDPGASALPPAAPPVYPPAPPAAPPRPDDAP